MSVPEQTLRPLDNDHEKAYSLFVRLREKRRKLDCGLRSPATAKKLPSCYVWAGTGNAEACQKLITARKPPQQGCAGMPGHGGGEKAEPLAQQHGHNEQENAHSCIHITVTTMCFCLLFSSLVLLEALFLDSCWGECLFLMFELVSV